MLWLIVQCSCCAGSCSGMLCLQASFHPLYTKASLHPGVFWGSQPILWKWCLYAQRCTPWCPSQKRTNTVSNRVMHVKRRDRLPKSTTELLQSGRNLSRQGSCSLDLGVSSSYSFANPGGSLRLVCFEEDSCSRVQSISEILKHSASRSDPAKEDFWKARVFNCAPA